MLTKLLSYRPTAASATAILLAGASTHAGEISVPAGYSADTILQVPLTNAKLVSVGDSDFPSNVMLVQRVGDDYVVSSVHENAIVPFTVIEGLGGPTPALSSVEFDPADNFADDAILIASRGGNVHTRITSLTSAGVSELEMSFTQGDLLALISPLAPGSPYGLGAIVYDAWWGPNGPGIYLAAPGASGLTELSGPIVPPGRADLDVKDMTQINASGYPQGTLVVDVDDNDDVTAIYILQEPISWFTLVSPVSWNSRQWWAAEPFQPEGYTQGVVAIDKLTGELHAISPDGAVTLLASGFDNPTTLATDSATGAMYVGDADALYRIRPDGAIPGPRMLAHTPFAGEGVAIRRAQPIHVVGLVFSEPVVTDMSDITITDEDGSDLPFSMLGTGSQTITLLPELALANGVYTIVVSDSVTSLDGRAFDGDGDGLAGGEATLVVEHRCPSDISGNGDIDVDDLVEVILNWGSCQDEGTP